jgi:phage RecT family recombinase
MTDQGRQDPRRSVVGWLNSGHIEAEIKRALPDHIPLPWFLRCAQTALLNNPNLANADKASLLRELVSVAQLGLVIDPQLGEAWLIIDRNGKVQRRVGYQGLRRLAMQSGEVTSLNAQAVYRNDRCSITLGDSPSVTHEIKLQEINRGDIIGYYAVARVKGIGEPVVEWMSQTQVEAHRDRYSDAYKGGKSGPWADPLAAVEMGRKTVFRRLAKWLPKSPLLAEALADEDRADMRDVTPSGHDMLPAPSDDPMDQVVAHATTQHSRQEPATAPATEPGTETAAEAAPPAGRRQARTVPPVNVMVSAQHAPYEGGEFRRAEPLRTGLDDGPPLKRRPGRPTKAEAAARQQAQHRPAHELEAMVQERTARDIIAEINATDPADVSGLMMTHEEAIAGLPEELRTEVVAAAHERMSLADDGDLDDGLPPDLEPGPDPLDAEGKPPVGETPSEDDGFEDWRADMDAKVAGMPRDMRKMPARKNIWLAEAERAGWGERGTQAVEEAFAR